MTKAGLITGSEHVCVHPISTGRGRARAGFRCDATEAPCLLHTEARVDSTITTVISQLDSISSLKEEQRTALKAFLRGNDVFALLPTGLLYCWDQTAYSK